MNCDAWGIVDGYHDAAGVWRATTEETRAALRRAMGAGATADASPGDDRVRVLRLPEDSRAADLRTEPADLTLEDGTALRVDDTFPPDLPWGYHRLQPLRGGPAERLIVSPGRCHLPEGLRAWGWAVQLYAARSAQSWGIGDLADLRRLARWSAAGLGAGLLLVNPLGAAAPVRPQEPSPYYPCSRRYRNPLYLRIEEVPGAAEAGLDLESLAAAGRALNAERRLDRDAVFGLKTAALDRLWARFGGDPGFDAYRRAQGQGLEEFAAFCVLTERYGRGWRGWPPEVRRPDAPGVGHLAAARGERVAFHAWLQWLLDAQLARAAAELPLMHDLPVGFDPEGADAWVWQDLLALDMALGAPPDDFNLQGQNWGLPPFVPHKLRAAGYAPIVQTLRAVFTHAAALRIDHVMGLFRLFWIPERTPVAAGTYVRYPADELLAIVALESRRAGAFVVGEDLGTVEEGVRERLAAHRMLGTRLLCFERGAPGRLPPATMAAYTTHDLPTIAGLWSGAEELVQERLGLLGNARGTHDLADILRVLVDLPPGTPARDVIAAVHTRLAEAPSAILTATLEDACAAEERPNVPGTFTEWPNWSLALPQSLEALEGDPLAHRIGRALARR